MEFKLQAPFQPMGDQPEAIRGLVDGVNGLAKHQVLLGATGTGQDLYHRIRHSGGAEARPDHGAQQDAGGAVVRRVQGVLPENAVSYFVSYYDYYQPEAYVPRHDLFIEKETQINEEIERLRLAATTAH
jgi:excinuclease ABC subunit B